MEPLRPHRDFIPLEARSNGTAGTKRALPLTGFTLVELLVVFAIIMVLTAVTITSQSSFNKTLVLGNTAYDLALTLRFAESYGLGTRAFGTQLKAGYGLHFQNTVSNSFTFFADTFGGATCGTGSSPDCKLGNHTYSTSDTFVQTYTFGNGITIGNFCAKTGPTWLCRAQRGTYGGGLTSLDIIFERPNPDAYMSTRGVYSASNPVTDACIILVSPQGGEKFVSVRISGQIVANAASCP